jgi:hypothetical protein
MEQEEPTSEFYKQLGGSATANLMFAVAFFIYRTFSQKCRHSKCKSTSKCLTCSAQEDSIDNSKDEEFQREIKEEMLEMQRRFDRRLRSKRCSVISIDDLELRSPSRKHQVVEKRKIEEQV